MLRIFATSDSGRKRGSSSPSDVRVIWCSVASLRRLQGVVHTGFGCGWRRSAGNPGATMNTATSGHGGFRHRGFQVAELTSPRATRTAIPRWLDVRLAVGVLLVLV